jgi:twitching motility protein PilU
VLLNSPLISDLIFKGEVHGQALFDLYEAGRIGYEDALRFADSTNEVRLNIKLNGKEAKGRDLMSNLELAVP